MSQTTDGPADTGDERALSSVADGVLDGLRRSSEGQPGQEEMLVISTAMRAEPWRRPLHADRDPPLRSTP